MPIIQNPPERCASLGDAVTQMEGEGVIELVPAGTMRVAGRRGHPQVMKLPLVNKLPPERCASLGDAVTGPGIKHRGPHGTAGTMRVAGRRGHRGSNVNVRSSISPPERCASLGGAVTTSTLLAPGSAYAPERCASLGDAVTGEDRHGLYWATWAGTMRVAGRRGHLMSRRSSATWN